LGFAGACFGGGVGAGAGFAFAGSPFCFVGALAAVEEGAPGIIENVSTAASCCSITIDLR
jgi:hypothetical protein